MKSLAALFVIASICLWSTGNCLPVSSEESDEIRLPLNPTLSDLQRERQRFVLELKEIERDVDENLFEKDFSDVRKELRKLELVIWPRLLQLNERILKDPTGNTDVERRLQGELQQIANRIKTKAGPHA